MKLQSLPDRSGIALLRQPSPWQAAVRWPWLPKSGRTATVLTMSPPPQLRVALFSGNYNHVRDGANQALNKLVGYLESQGVPVRVYSPTGDTPAFPPTGTLISAPSVPIPGRTEYRFGIGINARVRRDIEAFAPTLFHLSAPDLLGFAAKREAKRLGIPAVASFHTRFDTYFQFYGLGWFRKHAENILRRFYSDLPEVYATSEGFAEVLREQGISDHIEIWSRGIDRTRFNPQRRSLEWRRTMGIADSDVVIGFVGRLVLEKGLDVVAATKAELERRGVACKLLIVGDGPARDTFEAQAPGAIFTGQLSGDALAVAYASFDMLINPSTTETFGNVTLEAMASGLPVVAALATGNNCLVDDGVSGALVPPGDIAAFADAIAALIADPQARAAAGAAGVARAQGYDWDTINGEMLTHYRAVVANYARQRMLAGPG